MFTLFLHLLLCLSYSLAHSVQQAACLLLLCPAPKSHFASASLIQPFHEHTMTSWTVYKENKYQGEQAEDKGEYQHPELVD